MRRWAHSPSHEIRHPGAYIVTAGTLHKQKLFKSESSLQMLQSMLFEYAEEFGWQLQAWAIFANHYHFVALSKSENLSAFIRKLHANSARELNKQEGLPGRKVWHEFWDTRITFPESYLARLAYVHNNPVKHGLVRRAEDYEFCSAAWFSDKAASGFRDTVLGFKTNKVNVRDEF